MRRFAEGIAFLAAGIIAGAVSAYLVIENTGDEPLGNGGPWSSRVESLTGNDAFYVRAYFMMQGRLPPAPGQIDEATAVNDSDGQALTGNCRYRIATTGPQPRWWSIAVMNTGTGSPSLQAIASSDTVILAADGTAIIKAGASPLPGNWLRTEQPGRYSLLYSAVATGAQRLPGAPPFTIKREACR